MTESRQASTPKLFATVRRLAAGDDPAIEIYHVELSRESAVWTETFGSKEQLGCFLKGLRAAAGMMGFALDVLKTGDSGRGNAPL